MFIAALFIVAPLETIQASNYRRMGKDMVVHLYNAIVLNNYHMNEININLNMLNEGSQT